MPGQTYECAKCGGRDFDKDEIRTTGGGLSRFFDVQNRKFITVSCTRCGYTELFRKDTSTAGNILDFLVGS